MENVCEYGRKDWRVNPNQRKVFITSKGPHRHAHAYAHTHLSIYPSIAVLRSLFTCSQHLSFLPSFPFFLKALNLKFEQLANSKQLSPPLFLFLYFHFFFFFLFLTPFSLFFFFFHYFTPFSLYV